MESLDMFIPSHSVGGGSTSQPGPSSQHKRPTQPNKYTFVDLTTPDPTPSPTKSNASPQQSSQGSNTTYKPPAQSQSSQSSYYDLIPLGSKQRPHPTFTRPAQSSQRSAFAPFPSYSSPAMSTSNNPAGLSKDRYLAQGDVNAPIDLTKGDPPGAGFGSSILKSKNSAPSRSNPSSQGQGRSFVDFIKPSSGAFTSTSTSAPHRFQPPQPASTGTVGRAPDKAWPSWLANPASQHNPLQAPGQSHAKAPQPIAVPDDEPQGEVFDLNKIEYNQADWERHQGDADEHMRELLSGAVGDGEDDMGEDKVQEGEDIVEGFADNVRLMPHQVRGVRWMRQRESARKYGGILADDMGLGKTVQTLARVVEGKATTAELKAGWKAGTLIIAPLAVMEQWATEVRSKTKPGALTVTTHHGPSRTKSGKTLQGFDVVITTFQTVASEYTSYKMEGSTQPHKQPSDDQLSSDDSLAEKLKKKKMPKKKGSHAVFDVKWLRVVVDEAQNIKNRNTNAAKSAVALKAKYRWCLTGTPIQNNVEELFSLFRFLRAKPLDNWDVFRARISSLVKDGRTQMAMKRLHVVLKAIMLRRTKDATIDGKPILNLPQRKVEVVRCEFDDEERAFYAALEAKTELTFNKFLRSGSVMQNYTSVLTMLLRLRQACDHPSLVTSAVAVDKEAIDNSTDEAIDDDLAKMLSGLEVEEDAAKCETCFTILSNKAHKTCAECKELASKALIDPKTGLPPDSAKIRMLMKLLKDIEERSRRKEKTIVFSQFTSFMNIIEPFLKAEGVKYVRYDGSMRNDKRQEALHIIKTSPEVRVILISFKAGSTGLNLTCCNNVILMDLWWNPALEDQAFDRAHRLGQMLDVNIWKLTIETTVEDRMLELQTAKRELAAAALSGHATKGVMKLTLNDMMALFRATG